MRTTVTLLVVAINEATARHARAILEPACALGEVTKGMPVTPSC